ncbi:DUF4230 domain-containing protein [Sungkyunkwania multivorans]|uniref:DUF4230 domain-containing protein n=1 Tax=Sungkyunkwania multivorans TaxID=1173618 RepID=A0ABW3D4D1_9FLAO
MDNLFDTILGIILGAIVMYWVFSLFRKRQSKEVTKKQSVVLLEKIRSVCKLISVEGDFAEIYHHEDTKGKFLNLLMSKKKALLVINAKAYIGYDLGKVKLRADDQRKRIILDEFPQPEVLSIQPDVQYYDIQNGLFNRFDHEDLSTLNKEAKQHILNKIPESGLMETAKKEALDAVLMIENMVQAIGWQLDYSALELNANEQKRIKS